MNMRVLLAVLIVVSAASSRASSGKTPDRLFDITSYGARADATHDNSPAIRRAIEAAVAAGGGTIVFPPAKQPYLITDSIRLHASHLHIEGAGATVLLKDGAATGRTSADDTVHIVRIQGTPDAPITSVSVTGLTIDANYWGQTNNTASWQQSAKLAGIMRGIVVNHASHVLVRDVTIDRPFVGLTFRLGSHHCEAHNVKVMRFHHDAFGVTPGYVSAGASHIVFRNCVAADSPHGQHGGLPGTRIKGWEIEEGAQHVRLIDCVVRDTSANGFYVRPHTSRGQFETSHIDLIRCRVENAGKNAFIIMAYSHQQSVRHVRLVDCVAERGTLALHLNPDHVLIQGGRFKHATVGFFKDYDDPHHFADGPSKHIFDLLPVRSVSFEDVHITGDMRINMNPANDGHSDYVSDIRFRGVHVGGDVHVVGPPRNRSAVSLDDCTIAGATHKVTIEDYLRPLYDARKLPAMREGIVRQANSAPVIDGDAGDACWSSAARMDIVNQYTRPTGRQGGHSFVRVCYDSKAMYVLSECLESDMDTLITYGSQRDADLWFDDCIEVFVHRSDDPESYFRQWMVNAAGVVYDGDQIRGEQWNSSVRVAVKKLSDRYFVELALPWADLGGPPKRGEKVLANFTRNRTANDTRWIWSWRYDDSGAFADTDRMGTLTLE